jgi:Holliday junction resolvase RusA-like endonuclease
MSSRFTVTLDLPPSSNHMYVKRYKTYVKNGKKRKRLMNVLSDRACEWMEKAGDEAVLAMKEQGWTSRKPKQKVVVELRVWWPDRRKRDVHNLHKLLADCLEGRVADDDQWMLLRDMDFDYDKGHARVEVTAYDLHPE